MMRHIAALHLVSETAQDTFAATPWAAALATDSALPSVYGLFYSQLNNPMFQSLPYFLQQTGYRNPTDVAASNWQFSKGGAPNNLFQDLSASPELAVHFHDTMKCHSRYNLTPWPDVYPTETVVAAASSEPYRHRPLVVDIGGSKGHDLESFRARHPDVPEASLVLQDLPEVLAGLQLDAAIRPQAHDFFTPQPVSGARVYFLHNVLHDWPDDKAAAILGHTAAAMERGYSRLLVHESLISAVRPLARVTTSDITMMACLSAKERTEEEWRRLVEGAGLRVVKFWGPVHSVESIIEAELA